MDIPVKLLVIVKSKTISQRVASSSAKSDTTCPVHLFTNLVSPVEN